MASWLGATNRSISAPAQVVAAVLSSPTPSGTLGTPTSATIGATTTQGSGTFYAVIDSAANLVGVTATQIKAGQNKNGAAAVSAGNAVISGTSPSVSLSSLIAATLYSYDAVQNNTNGDSNIVGGTFTTGAAADFFADPYSSYGDPRIVDPSIASDVSGGTPTTETWNGVTKSYQCYKTIQFAMGDWFSSSGGRRVGLLAGTTYTLTAVLYVPVSGASDAARNILQGDPAALANNMPHIDQNGSSTTGTSHEFKVNANNNADWFTVRKVEVSNVAETANSGSGISLNPGTTQTASGLIIEFCYLHDFVRNNGSSDIGCVGLSQTTMTYANAPIIRYSKLYNCNQGGNGKATQGNTSGVYIDKVISATIQNCDINNCGNATYHKVATAGGSVGAPNGMVVTNTIIRTCNTGNYLGGAGASVNAYFGTDLNGNLYYDLTNNPLKADSDVLATPQCDTIYFRNNTVGQDCGDGPDIAQTNNIIAYNNFILCAGKFTTTTASSPLTSTYSYCDYNGYATSSPSWKLNRNGSPSFTYSTLAGWQASFTNDNSPVLQFNPDAHAIGSLTTANVNNAAARDYSPIAGSTLLTNGRGSGTPTYMGAYNASSIAASNLVGPGW